MSRKVDNQQYLTLAAALSKDMTFHPWLGFAVWISSNPRRFNDGPGNNTLEVTGKGASEGYKVIEDGTEPWWLKPDYLGGGSNTGKHESEDLWPHSMDRTSRGGVQPQGDRPVYPEAGLS